jgi:hypothetical protein
MDTESKAKLDAILAIEPAALTDEDKVFLRARSSYLTVNQREVYAEVLSELSPEVIAKREATDAQTEQRTPEATSEVTTQESSADETPRRSRKAK